MYLKVYYNDKGKDATVEQVEQVLPQDMQGLTVDAISGSCPIVNFPEGSSHADWQRVKKILHEKGFETE